MRFLYRLHSTCKAASGMVEVPCTGGAHASVDSADFATPFRPPPFAAGLGACTRGNIRASKAVRQQREVGGEGQAEAGHQGASK